MILGTFSAIPDSSIRHHQIGDWAYTETSVHAFVSEDCPEQSKLPILFHELIESILCRRDGISDESVCDFDEQYEKERAEGKHGEYDEPGDDPRAPYRQQHMAATHVERAVCHVLGINWTEHSQLALLSESVPPKKSSPAPGLPLSCQSPPPPGQGSSQ